MSIDNAKEEFDKMSLNDLLEIRRVLNKVIESKKNPGDKPRFLTYGELRNAIKNHLPVNYRRKMHNPYDSHMNIRRKCWLVMSADNENDIGLCELDYETYEEAFDYAFIDLSNVFNETDECEIEQDESIDRVLAVKGVDYSSTPSDK